MRALCLSVLLLLPGGDREQGLVAYREGRYAEAQAAFARAAEVEPGDAELQWNLALAAWRAGDLAAAEVAAEKYAALAKNARAELHQGLLGAVRHDEAERLMVHAEQLAAGGAPAPDETSPPDPLPELEQALQKAEQARDYFVRGALAKATPELVRNTERTLRLIEALQKRIEELKQQRQPEQQEQQPGDQDEQTQQQPNPDGDEQQPEPKQKPGEDPADPSESQDPQQPQPSDPSQQEQPPEQEQRPQSGDEPSQQAPEPSGQQGEGEQDPDPEPQPEPQPKPQPESESDPRSKSDQNPGDPPPGEPQAGDRPGGQPEEPLPGEGQGDGRAPEPVPEERRDAPGEGAEGRELTEEQTQRLLEQLRQMEAQQRAALRRMQARRKPVERDW